ncbi:protein TIC 22-like, chloroplastic [Macadamia integrifolia]|uniref:protein TIC 22-like, chloroplastic n=1 Tax=Macadamia integrifolia TaxID=60698 RepID=UPI001C4F2EDD|nr:protein TIC 22-like, chloroplastic [Macadamia integrifolia]
MQFPKFKQPEISSTAKQAKPSFQQTFNDIRNHCSGFIQHITNALSQQQQKQPNFPFFNPNSSSLKTHLELALENLGNQAKRAFENGISGFGSSSASSARNPVWARVYAQNETLSESVHRFDLAMSTEAIEERLSGVPVYALSNSAEEFVLVSGVRTGKSLGLFCFKKEDAEALLEQMKSMDPGMRRGSKVVAVALNKVFQLKVEGVAFRFIPDSSQIKNALKERQKAGFSEDGFSGVPVFQSRSLILKSQNKRYRPVFFRKEDLENSLLRASQQQKQLNPAFKQGDIQVAVLEEIIQGMKESSNSKWEDVVFIPPGFDISVDLPTRQKLGAMG